MDVFEITFIYFLCPGAIGCIYVIKLLDKENKAKRRGQKKNEVLR